MKLWKENKVSQEYSLPNEEIAKRFLESTFYTKRYDRYGSTDRALVVFITSKEGLNSTWEWNEKKGSIEGSKDMTEILNIIDEETKK